MADFEKNHPGIAEQELWKLFVEKANEQGLDRDFISAVGKVCAIGLNLSKYIVRFFPTFTLHDETHSANVCRWMWVLLGEQRAQVTVHEAALLLMAACCHDIGMAVSPEQEQQMRSREYPGWDAYFKSNLADQMEFEDKQVIPDRVLRNFVRKNHHERVGMNLPKSRWPQRLSTKGVSYDDFLELCRSHGTELLRGKLYYKKGKYDLLLCAVLLRLADLLDYDISRSPEVLFRHMGLDRPGSAEEKLSAEEYLKNQAGEFDLEIVDRIIRYTAFYDHPQQEQRVRGYLDWVEQELKHCNEELVQTGSNWQDLRLPYRIDDKDVVRKGYSAGKYCITMDQDKILDLLTGESLYSDAGVFVRELLQNSIDAVLMRSKLDRDFRLEDGLIQIDTWTDNEANTWFRIRDNGIGMNEQIIQDHFLKVGNSYYTSEAFRYANRHAPKGSYTAISRFGIGILSCFMGDKEDTQLKVSTKRFDGGPECGIRLDVKGLHGFYFLCSEKEHPEYEAWFPKLPESSFGGESGYRQTPGTTICVNVNLLRMGEMRSIREILDQYVQFPEVQVTYNGPEGYHEYPTQQKLMEAVYALNPGGVVKEYVHEIPEEEFERIKQEYPDYAWKERPKIVIRYVPTAWCTDTEKNTGVLIQAGLYRRNENNDLKQMPSPSLRAMMRRRSRMKNRIIDSIFQFAAAEADFARCPYEQKLWDLLRTHWQFVEDNICKISHNGVWVKMADWYQGVNDCQFGFILLREDFLPRLNMARNEILWMPLELECCISKIPGLHLYSGQERLPDHTMLATEREFWEILDKHRPWQDLLEKHPHFGYDTLEMLQMVTADRRILEMLWLAYWKRKCRVYRDNVTLCAEISEAPDEQTADFPAAMFVWMKGDTTTLKIGYEIGGCYNRSHPFSKWLIDNRASLAEQVPGTYDRLIRTMLLEHDADKIREKLNGILVGLKNRPGNPFRVPADLVLKENEFVMI